MQAALNQTTNGQNNHSQELQSQHAQTTQNCPAINKIVVPELPLNNIHHDIEIHHNNGIQIPFNARNGGLFDHGNFVANLNDDELGLLPEQLSQFIFMMQLQNQI